jgi:hypothetical protein
VLFALTGLLKLGSFGFVVIGAAVAVVAVLMVYSYVIWRNDPSRRTTPNGK